MPKTAQASIADALRGFDDQDRVVNITDAALAIAAANKRIAEAITPYAAGGANDANGQYVSSLTEATMGVTGGLVRIAEAIQELSNAIGDLANACSK